MKTLHYHQIRVIINSNPKIYFYNICTQASSWFSPSAVAPFSSNLWLGCGSALRGPAKWL